MSMYEVIVGNIGSVLRSDNAREARLVFGQYARQSAQLIGRASGEDVTLLKDGELEMEYSAPRNKDGELSYQESEVVIAPHMGEFRFRFFTHDKIITTHAMSWEAAIKQIMKAEKCPQSAIKSITRVED